MTVLTPRRPEFKQNNFAFDRFIIEAFPGGSFRTESWGGRSVLVSGEGTGCEKQAQTYREVRGKAHSGGIRAQQSSFNENFSYAKTLSGIAAQTERIGALTPFCLPFSSGFDGNFCHYP
jgi:hypothetical protein